MGIGAPFIKRPNEKHGEKMCTMVHASWLVALSGSVPRRTARRDDNDKFKSTAELAEGAENSTMTVVHTFVSVGMHHFLMTAGGMHRIFRAS